MTKVNKFHLLTVLSFAISGLVTGCGNNQSSTVVVVPTPSANLNSAEQKFVTSLLGMTPKQQAEFMRNNPKMARNPAVMNKLRQDMPRVMVKQGPGRKPQLDTGRPNF